MSALREDGRAKSREEGIVCAPVADHAPADKACGTGASSPVLMLVEDNGIPR